MTLENKNLVNNYPSAKYSWLKSGGKISHLYKICNQNDLSNLFLRNDIKDESLLVIGNLSNTLIKDDGFKGIGIKLQGDFTNVQINNDHMLVGAAVLDNYLSKFCYKNGISGYEFLYTIPGSIGGNIFMNAGCYNQEIKDKLLSIIFYDIYHNKVYEKI
jgi:UDP-N-acetylmuramate dehydrogenase